MDADAILRVGWSLECDLLEPAGDEPLPEG